VVADAGGYAIYVGGSPRAGGKALGHARNAREAMEYLCGFLQLFREERGRRETVSGFIRRVGVLYAHEPVAKDGLGRSLLARRFLAAATPQGRVSDRNCAFSRQF
jgi:NAD(P)H-nitrite reductase large subunit